MKSLKKAKLLLLLVVGMLAIACAYSVGYKQGKESIVCPSPISTPESTPTVSPVPTQSPSSTPEIDTSDWKVYRNEEYGFEIKNIEDRGDVINFTSSPRFKMYNPYENYYFSIAVLNNPSQLSLEDWIKRKWVKICEENKKREKQGEIISPLSKCVNGRPRYVREAKEVMINKVPMYVIRKFDFDSDIMEYYIAKEKLIYQISFSLYPALNSDEILFKDLYKEVVHSFRIIKNRPEIRGE